MLLFAILTEAISAPDDSIERSVIRELSTFVEPNPLATIGRSPALTTVVGRPASYPMNAIIPNRILV